MDKGNLAHERSKGSGQELQLGDIEQLLKQQFSDLHKSLRKERMVALAIFAGTIVLAGATIVISSAEFGQKVVGWIFIAEGVFMTVGAARFYSKIEE